MLATERNSGSILIVEDNPIVTRALALLLHDQGFNTVIFDRGQSAIDYIQEERNVPDAALIDIHLPDVSGFEVTKHLRSKLGESAPIIILSGDNSIETLRSLPRVGATYFFSKPVNSTTLIEQLKTWLSKSPV